MQALKGLSGGFLTVYDRQTLYQAVKTYTVDQDRNLLRYQLNLTKKQKTGLIQRLYLAKKNFKSKYYFFDRNCASILVQIIGEGIGDREIAEFDPFVVPPNSLVALFIRKGLATQTFPSFYSYRKKGYIAQEELRERLVPLGVADGPFLSSSEHLRKESWEKLATQVKPGKIDPDNFFALTMLGQDAELSFLDRTQRCENYTSEVTAHLRQVQKDLLSKHGVAVARTAVDTNVLINEKFKEEEGTDSRTGSANTQVSSVAAGFLRALDKDQPGYFVNFAIHKQESGTVASQAMQRATAVTLGELSFRELRSKDGDGQFVQLQSWQLTGLDIKKFKERLYDVPPWYSEHGKFGIGLKLLKLRKDAGDPHVDSTLGGGALLFNLVSSRLYLDYLYVSVGTDLDVIWRMSHTSKLVPVQTAVVIPLGIDGLVTLGSTRLWQLRGNYTHRLKPVAGQTLHERQVSLSVQYRVPERLDSEFLIVGSVNGIDRFDDYAKKNSNSEFSLGLEWNRW